MADGDMGPIVSWTGLQRHEQCRQKHLRFIERKQSKAADSRVFLPGTITDRLMRDWMEPDELEPGWMEAHVDEYFQKYAYDETESVIRWRSKDDPHLVRNFIRETVLTMEPILVGLTKDAEAFEPNVWFRQPVRLPSARGGLQWATFLGGIDLTVKKDGAWHLYDLKTTKNEDYWRKCVGQGIFYTIAFGHKVEPPESFWIFQPACKQKLVQIKIEQADKNEMIRRVSRMVDYIVAKDWSPKQETTGCSYCEVQHACDRFASKTDSAGRRRVSLNPEQT